MIKKKIQKKKSYNTQLKNTLELLHKDPTNFVVKSMNPQGKECRILKHLDLCFCGHNMGKHLNGDKNNLSCTSENCSCQEFKYIPGKSIKCLCKHSPLRHDPIDRKCLQCICCLGFVTHWSCSCGSRLLEHSSVLYGTIGKKNDSSIKLPKIKENTSVNYPQTDLIKQSKIQYNIADESYCQDQKENEHRAYLKEKLRLANNRYFAKLKSQQKINVNEQRTQTTAFDLLMKPHLYQSYSLSKFIDKVTNRSALYE